MEWIKIGDTYYRRSAILSVGPQQAGANNSYFQFGMNVAGADHRAGPIYTTQAPVDSVIADVLNGTHEIVFPPES
jgi:hypothetical protein